MERYITRTSDAKTSPFFSRVELKNVSKVDLVFIAQRRGSPMMSAVLHGLNMKELVKHIEILPVEGARPSLFDNGEPSPFLTLEEEAMVQARRRAREKVGMSSEEMKFTLQSNELAVPSTKEHRAQAILDAGCPERKSIKPDPGQARAIEGVYSRKKTIIYAGPGAGKTTTVALIAAAAPVEMRVLILSFTRGAENELKRRFKRLRNPPRILSRKGCATNPAPGILIVTFDKYIANMRNRGAIAGGGYEQSFERGLAMGPGKNECWDMIIVDEAQDVMQNHRRLIEQLIPRVRSHVVIAGDPRQELFTGAVWFSSIYENSEKLEWGVEELEYNHRAEPGVVAALNKVSEILFPTLHRPQKHPKSMLDTKYSAENCFGASINWVITGDTAGYTAAEILCSHRANEAFALTPVTIDKWRNDRIVASIRQGVYSSGSNKMVLTLGGKNTLTDYAYYIGTARTAKGSERDHVIVFATDNDYTNSGIVAYDAFVKMLYVCLSRTRKTCTILLAGPPAANYILSDLLPSTIPRAPEPQVRPLNMIGSTTATDAAKLEFWNFGLGRDAVDAALAGMEKIDIPGIEIESDKRYTDKEVSDLTPDADIIGMAVEASLAGDAGFDLTMINAIIPAAIENGRLTESVGLVASTKGAGFDLLYDPRKVKGGARGKALFAKELRTLIDSNLPPAYLNVVLQRSAEIGSVWCVSNRLSLADAVKTESWHTHLALNRSAEVVSYQRDGVTEIYSHRSSEPTGHIYFRTDFEERDPEFEGVPGRVHRVIEIKHTEETTREHVAQACIYATLRAAPTLLVNTNTATQVLVPPLPLNDLANRLRAYFAIRSAASVNNILAMRKATRRIPHLTDHVGRPIIVVDIEGGRVPSGGIGGLLFEHAGKSIMTEIGAVCIDLSRQERVLDCFHIVSPGCSSTTDASCASTSGTDEFKTRKKQNDDAVYFSEAIEETHDVGFGADDSDTDEGEARMPSHGTGEPGDPWVPFDNASLAVIDPIALWNGQRHIAQAFETWWKSISPIPPLIVQWAGNDTRALSDALGGNSELSTAETFDAWRAYRWYLESIGEPRFGGTRLSDACMHLLGPTMPFHAHRAFEDAIITAAVLVAIQHVGGTV